MDLTGTGGWTGPDISVEEAANYRPNAGYRVHKIGANTGYSEGTVLDACAHRHVLGDQAQRRVFLICQAVANYWSHEGDSGAPVFSFHVTTPGSVTTLGVHHGIWDGLPLFGSLVGVRTDLGVGSGTDAHIRWEER